jgi:hypothetical protein
MFAALVTIVMATVFGHVPFSAEANQPEYWCENGTKIEKTDQTYYWIIDQKYEKVIVKAGSGFYGNTIYLRPEPGLGAYADTNGNYVFDPGGRFGDKAISHVILCPIEGGTESPSPTPSPTASQSPTSSPTSKPSPTQSQGPTPAPSASYPPSTATGQGGAESDRVALAETGPATLGAGAIGLLLASLGYYLILLARKE